MKQINEALFRSVCLSFSAFLLILLLLTDIDLAAEKDRCARLASEVESITVDNELLRARIEQRLSLDSLDRYARETLGLVPCAPGQLVALGELDE